MNSLLRLSDIAQMSRHWKVFSPVFCNCIFPHSDMFKHLCIFFSIWTYKLLRETAFFVVVIVVAVYKGTSAAIQECSPFD